jgi:hypothetical protein
VVILSLAISEVIFETPASDAPRESDWMKSEFDQWKTPLFFGVLAIVALIINCCFWLPKRVSESREESRVTAQPPPTIPPEATPVRREASPTASLVVASPPAEDPAIVARRAAEAAAEARKNYLDRYLNSGIERKTGTSLVAVVATSEDGKIERDVGRALAARLKTNGVEIVGSFFKPEFVSDGLANEMFSESTALKKKLELGKSLDGLLLARQTVGYSSNPSLENVITAEMSLDVIVQTTSEPGESQTWMLHASGAGFNRTAARSLAQERICKQIAASTNLSLTTILAAKQAQ